MRYHTTILSIFFLLFIFAPLNAAEENVREVTAFGTSKKEAVVNALVEAVQQVKGLKIAGIERIRSSLIETYSSQNGEDKNDLTMANFQNQEILKQTQGIISSYEILNIDKSDEGHGWEVLVRVHIPTYETPGTSHDTRRKMVVIPFRTMEASYDFNGRRISSSEISRQFTQKLITEITQTRRFAVLDREYMDEFLSEKKLILSADAPVSEQAKLGEVLGADYLLIGTITGAGQTHTRRTIQVTGEAIDNYAASFRADYRIMVLATRQIKWSDSMTISLDDVEIKSIVRSPEPDKIQQLLLDKAARQIIHKALENIYPIIVVTVQQNGEIILNQGGVTLSDGEILEVFNKGEEIIDPYTGESLGASETWAATVEISRVIPKMSYARVIKGQVSSIKNGSICRRVSAQRDESISNSDGRSSTIVPAPGGGVFLPFDVKTGSSSDNSFKPAGKKYNAALRGTAVSDIDNDIPVSNIKNNSAIAVVIGNKDYLDKDIPSVDYAMNDAQSMRFYLIKVFGYKEGNVIFITNATKAGFEALFGTKDEHQGKLYNYLKKGDSDIFIYYSGHGAPDPQSNSGFFVPVDADSQALSLTGYSLRQFYDNVTKISKDKESPNVYIIIDACFSGVSEKGLLLKNVSPVHIELENPLISIPNAVIMTSSSGTEVSSWYPEKKHSMFTYFFLKTINNNIMNGKQRITANDIFLPLSDETDGVPYFARRLHGRLQTPKIFGEADRVMIGER